MFSIIVNEEKYDDETLFEVELIFKSDTFSFSFTPENYKCLTIVDDTTESFDSNPCNGTTSFEWNKDKIIFQVGKFGDGNGNGGLLSITLPNTPAIQNSLNDTLDIWRKL